MTSTSKAQADAIAAGQAGGMRTGVVSAIDPATGGVQVTINGTTVPSKTTYLNCVSGYLPRLGDTVAIYRQDSSWMVLGATSRSTTYSRYTGGATVLTASAWNVLPFGTLAEGPGLYLTNNGSGIFTLGKSGLWTVNMIAVTGGAAGLTGAFVGLFANAATTTGPWYSENQSPILSNQTGGSCVADILSDGTTTVCAAIFPLGGAPTIFVGGSNRTPLLSFHLHA